ncbi:MAG: peptidoglycan DD-metalloendopeptidase family protein [Candidatus Pacebacteria bacterium]|nr:peptidoglycan DD-metalloendopeptidase family protein [Candidatus Paceibacterota bacterium]
MFSLKTKDVPPKRTFLIALIVIAGSTMAFTASSLVGSSKNSDLVKDDSVLAIDALEAQEADEVAPLVLPDDKPIITVYTVKEGDTISTIASSFSISTNTLLWANDLTRKSTIKVGQKLTILPVTGIQYTVAKGNTLGGIANKFDVSVEEIVSFNDLEDGKPLKVGAKLIIPNAELPEPAEVEAKPKTVTKVVEVKKEIAPVKVVATTSVKTEKEEETETPVKTETTSSYFTHPIPGSVLTQGAHGYNGVDFGAPTGTKVLAAASGKVLIAKGSGYNGGYGENIVIEHDNGTQTLYAHLSSVLVSEGDEVTKGQKIALSGNTGRSTGPHLHFEVRGGTNPWTAFKKLTKF